MSQQNSRILIIEDEPKVASFVKRGLGENGFSIVKLLLMV